MLFRDIHRMRIVANIYPFDLVTFLEIIKGEDSPETLEFILIEGGTWINENFTHKIKEKYAAAGIQVEKKKGKTYWSLHLKF